MLKEERGEQTVAVAYGNWLGLDASWKRQQRQQETINDDRCGKHTAESLARSSDVEGSEYTTGTNKS
jgi:hypothetical protein